MQAYWREVAVGISVLLAGSVYAKYTDVPVRVSVIETRVDAIEKGFDKMDKKIDILLRRYR